MKEDLPARDEFVPASRTVGAFFQSVTMPDGLYLLDDGLLPIRFVDHKAKSGIRIFNTKGQLLGQASGFKRHVRHAEEGRIYVVNTPGADENGLASNPPVDVYRYIDPRKK